MENCPTYDIAIIGAGIAGASVASALGDSINAALVEQEQQPGYHSTGRSAALFRLSHVSKSDAFQIEVAEKSASGIIMKNDHEIENDKKPDHTQAARNRR